MIVSVRENSTIIFSLEFLTEKMRFIGEKILYLQRYNE